MSLTKSLVAAILVVIALLTNTRQITFGQSLNDLRQKRDTIGRDIDRKKQELEKKRQEAVRVEQQIQSLDKEIGLTEQRINQVEGQIVQTQTTINQLSQTIDQKQTELTAELANKKEAIMVLYETTEQNPIFLVAGSNGISQAVDRASYLEALESKIESAIKKIVELVAQLEGERQHHQQQKLALEQLLKQQETYRHGIESQKKQRTALLQDTKNAQKTLEQLIEDAKKAYADVNSDLHRLQELAKKNGRTTGAKRVGSLSVAWPITGEITTRFGEPTFVQVFHTGIDIDCIIGDSITAAADGQVTYVGGDKSYGYGWYVKINHGDGISTLYAHLSGFEVGQSDQVKMGQVIGYCGNTGYARAFLPGGDGSHLHLEFREDDVPINPYIYLP